VGDDYLWVWTDRCDRATVLRVRGELDVVTADRFIAAAASELRQATGPVSIDLSFLDYLDCAGARALEAVVRALPPWRLTEVRGIQRPVARLLELIGMDLSVPTAVAFLTQWLAVRHEQGHVVCGPRVSHEGAHYRGARVLR